MNSNIRVRAKFQESDQSWYLDIIPPIYLNGAVVIQEGTLYFPKPFNSKEQAYEMARSYLKAIGINREVIDSRIDYE
jgi:hypothetical protein